jgi:hypothetical protein
MELSGFKKTFINTSFNQAISLHGHEKATGFYFIAVSHEHIHVSSAGSGR